MQKLKVNDEVIVIAGKDKGKKGKIKKINLKKNAVLVDGVNLAVKAMPRSKDNAEGGHVKKELFIDRSNVAIVDPKTGKATRVKIIEKGGKRQRVTVKSGVTI
ncbi:MAG: 50S ribosomal protein L24 [Oligoflexia bacterium]|nr:50S ribosomal protein L24 [Oligoflexia bacterium]